MEYLINLARMNLIFLEKKRFTTYCATTIKVAHTIIHINKYIYFVLNNNKKNPAYKRQSISRPVWIVAQIT